VRANIKISGAAVCAAAAMLFGAVLPVSNASAASPPPPVLKPGPLRVAVILVNFHDENTEPWTLSDAAKQAFTGSHSARAYYREVTHGLVTMEGAHGGKGDVYGWYTLPKPFASNKCLVSAANNFTLWMPAAESLARRRLRTFELRRCRDRVSVRELPVRRLH
jgi:hypothetical protein